MARRDDEEYKIAMRDIAQYAYLSLGPFGKLVFEYSFPFPIPWSVYVLIPLSSESSELLLVICRLDRVKTAEWTRKLASVNQDNIEMSHLRNEYAQLLRIMVKGGVLHNPFHQLPPDGDLPPLAEALSACLVEKIPKLAKAGPIAPIISHRSAGGQVYLAAKQIPAGGIFCYLACSPDPMPQL